MPRTVWIHPVSSILGKILLGPEIRLMHLAEQLARCGHDVRVVLSSCSRSLPEGVTLWPEGRMQPPATEKDVIIVNPFLPLRKLWPLLRGPGHVVSDFYSVNMPEFLQEESQHPTRIFRIQRRRIWIRYHWLARRAETCVFSNPEQLAFLSGGLSHHPNLPDARLAGNLPSKSVFCPMGIDFREKTTGHPNPYPEPIRNRPIFLWGGGIWPWMDLDPLLDAFGKLKATGSDACLFFLSGAPVDRSSRLSAPVEKVRRRASELGILDSHVFLNPTSVPFEARLGYLEHCSAGILCNPPSIESSCSWRTRMLDLLLAGRTAVVAGYDPLSADLARSGAIVSTRLDPEEIARGVEMVADPARREELESKIVSVSTSHKWELTLEPLVSGLASGSSPGRHGSSPRLTELLRFALPF